MVQIVDLASHEVWLVLIYYFFNIKKNIMLKK